VSAVGRHGEIDRVILVIMGVSGCGKTTIGRAVAEQLGWAFQEGDALHPAANVAKMAGGTPLTDEDRRPWLNAVAAWIDDRRAAGADGVVTCSALKRAYRRVIVGDRPDVQLVYLRGDRDTIARRLAARSGHFMPPSLLQSQLDTLEEPAEAERALVVDLTMPADAIVAALVERLQA
jgi:carbohydrate kinase (thermoresistant glucokinase family)